MTAQRFSSVSLSPNVCPWLPCPGSERTLLYFHGNAGNLSHRGGSIVKIRKLLDTAVLIVDLA